MKKLVKNKEFSECTLAAREHFLQTGSFLERCEIVISADERYVISFKFKNFEKSAA